MYAKEWGGQVKFTHKKRVTEKVSDPRFSHFVAPLPVINEHSPNLVHDIVKVL